MNSYKNIFSVDFKNIDWRNLDLWPQSLKNTAIAAAGSITFLLVFLLFNLSQYSALHTAHQQETTLKQSLQVEIPHQLLITAQRQQLQQLTHLITQYQHYLLQPEQLGTLLDDITHAAADNQLDLELLKPNAPLKTDFYTTVPIEVALNGDYQQIGLFLNQLAHLPYFVYPRDLELTLPLNGTAGTLHLHLIIVMYNEPAKTGVTP